MKLKPYKRITETIDLNELIGFFKGEFNTLQEVRNCQKFKRLSTSDKEYIIDELKADGWK